MRDLDRIKVSKSLSVDRQKLSLIFATGIVAGVTIFTVGLYIGLRKPAEAEAATVDPLDDLIASGGDEAVPDPDGEGVEPTSLRYHEILGTGGEQAVTPPLVPAGDDVDEPLPVAVDASPIPMPSSAGKWDAGDFVVPTIPSVSAFQEPARISIPKKGQKGVFTVHVNSFSAKAEAAGYVAQLRKAGYKAFLVQAKSASRGTLYRVRIGPFFSHKDAWKFSKAFEKQEGVPTYIVQRVIEN
ncbi:MAG: SPOR domain-containing protein [Deltaproteobacteria bacterium]|nr:SPOR domain-containing protein [Deltaproteobacteria bacterium]